MVSFSPAVFYALPQTVECLSGDISLTKPAEINRIELANELSDKMFFELCHFISGNSPKIRLKITVISRSMYVPKIISMKIGEVTCDKKGVDASNVTFEGFPDGK